MIIHSPLKFEYVDDLSVKAKQSIMRLTEDMLVVCDRGGFKSFRVPKGMHTNGASIPQSAKTIIGGNFDGLYLVSAIVHDMLYLIQHNRKESDNAFYDMMRALGVGLLKANAMYQAVHLFGKDAFNSPIPQEDAKVLERIKISMNNKAEYEKTLSLIKSNPK